MRWTTLWSRRRGRPERTEETTDPWGTLSLQVRLGQLANELRRLEADADSFARAHHYLAAQAAYDALLREACRLTGVGVPDAPLRADRRSGEDERFRQEMELSSRGWSW